MTVFYFLYEDEKKRRSRAMNSLQTAIVWHSVEYLSRLLYPSKREMFSFQPNKAMSSLLEHGHDEKQGFISSSPEPLPAPFSAVSRKVRPFREDIVRWYYEATEW